MLLQIFKKRIDQNVSEIKYNSGAVTSEQLSLQLSIHQIGFIDADNGGGWGKVRHCYWYWH
jgi:hypothetical protein